MLPLRVACVRYLNTAPLVEGLDKLRGLTLLPMAPAHIADAVRRGDADLGLVSVVDAARTGDDELAMLPVGMIGCDGPTLTVRLFSAVPLHQITTLHADTDSHTSVVLARVLLRRMHAINPAIVDFDARERVAISPSDRTARDDAPAALDDAWPQSVLLIGDKVVTDHPPEGRYPHQLDLGEAWKALTGLPFVYAVWMCRASEADAPRIRTAAALLDRQRRHNATRLDWIIATRSREARWPHDIAARYLGELLRYDVGPREREAIDRFFEWAAEDGLLPRTRARWVEHAEAAMCGTS